MSTAQLQKKPYRITEGSITERFMNSTCKVQLFAGGFANGKTAAAVIKTLRIAKDYPGANILVARSTYPKLNDTIRKELYKWIPKNWVKRWPTKDENTMELKNGTIINFRYVFQQGKSNESTTSNLLSATYDLIVVDQIEDPEIVEKDFDDLMGRLRGSTPYQGDDPNMPRSGPRWFIITTNPTRNWVYKKLYKPVRDYQMRGLISEDLLCRRKNDKVIYDNNNKPILLIDIFEGSTYENKDNLEDDFIEGLESTYTGQMRDRFLLGKWAAYEGLVYPQFDTMLHMQPRALIMEYLEALRAHNYEPTWIEGYDHGLAVPSCYLAAFVDNMGNVFVVAGVYKKELPVSSDNPDEPGMAEIIKKYRKTLGIPDDNVIDADPQLFRRSPGTKQLVGKTVAGMFQEEGIKMRRGNNDIINGIVKVSSYLQPQKNHQNPLTETRPGPRLYFCDDLEFIEDEISAYFWATNQQGDRVDKPNDRNDHAMDTIKYMLSRRPKIAVIVPLPLSATSAVMRWNEQDAGNNKRRNPHRARRAA